MEKVDVYGKAPGFPVLKISSLRGKPFEVSSS
jgi:hypothetical protein